jgi:hypothetical protein
MIARARAVELLEKSAARENKVLRRDPRVSYKPKKVNGQPGFEATATAEFCPKRGR